MFDTLPTMMGYWDNNSEDSSTISSLGTLSGDYDGSLAGQGMLKLESLKNNLCGVKFDKWSSHKTFGRCLYQV